MIIRTRDSHSESQSPRKPGTSHPRLCLAWLVIALGLLLAAAPSLWSAFSGHQAAESIRLLQKEAETADQSSLEASLEQARLWNARLAGEYGQEGAVSESNGYEQQLCLYNHQVMGILTIPCIDVSLPIYHGCSQEALSNGAGHLPSSSLPVGSPSARAVLSAHRGLMSAALFTRLDEVGKGDVFLIENPKEKLAYQVESIEVILPENTEALRIVSGRDLVTLMTCTPYGINSHRLLVTGSRIEWNEKAEAASQSVPKSTLSWREQFFRLWPLVLFGLALLAGLGFWKKSRKES